MMRAGLSLGVAVVLTLGDFELAAQVANSRPPIRQVDHVMIRADEPARLYEFFTDVLQLPVAWPMVSPRAGVTTGGVGFGNVNVEAIRSPNRSVDHRRRSCSGSHSSPLHCVTASPNWTDEVSPMVNCAP